MLPYQVVPPSGEKKNHISVAFASVVRLTEPPGNSTVPPEKATVRLGVASLVRINVNDVALFEVLFALAKVNVQLPVNVAVKTCPEFALIVTAVPVFPSALTVSENRPLK